MITTLPALAEDYLADLDRALAGADPRERAETLAAVRDHIAESLGDRGQNADDVAAVIDGLGSVDEIAASATPAATVTARPPASPVFVSRPPAATTDRGDGWLVAAAVAGLLLFWFPPLAISTLVVAIVRLRSGRGDRARHWAALWLSVAALAILLGGVAILVPWQATAQMGPVLVTPAG